MINDDKIIVANIYMWFAAALLNWGQNDDVCFGHFGFHALLMDFVSIFMDVREGLGQTSYKYHMILGHLK